MPILKTSQKAMRKSARRRKLNLKRKDELKKVLKEYKKLAASDKGKAKEYLPKVYAKLDKSAKVNFIKKNKASRLKSRLSQLSK